MPLPLPSLALPITMMIGWWSEVVGVKRRWRSRRRDQARAWSLVALWPRGSGAVQPLQPPPSTAARSERLDLGDSDQGHDRSRTGLFCREGDAEAVEAGAALILVELNTFGGRVDAATEIRDTLIDAKVPTAAYVTERAWSAGALIALAAETIWMAPGSSIGAAQPVPADEKTVSALRAEFESTAERTGRDPRVAAAMVDAGVAVDGLVAPGRDPDLDGEPGDRRRLRRRCGRWPRRALGGARPRGPPGGERRAQLGRKGGAAF